MFCWKWKKKPHSLIPQDAMTESWEIYWHLSYVTKFSNEGARDLSALTFDSLATGLTKEELGSVRGDDLDDFSSPCVPWGMDDKIEAGN